MENRTISVAEALQKIGSDEPLNDVSIDFNHIKIEALDVMKLAKAGIAVPESAIYYDNDDIMPDEAFDGEWAPIASPPDAVATNVKIPVRADVRRWLDANQVQLDELLASLLEGFYRSQKIVSEKP